MHIDMTAVLVAAIAFLGSAGIWTLIDHRQQRKADREMQDSEILKEVKSIHKEIDELRELIDENEAKTRRVRILSFADEIYMDMNLSKDAYDQCLSDISDYSRYCQSHPDFKNDQTVETTEYIKSMYEKRLENKDFARYGKDRDKETWKS